MICIIEYLPVFIVTLDTIITQFNRRFSHVTNLQRNSRGNCFEMGRESTKFDSFKSNTTLSNLRLKQSKIRLRFNINLI